MDKELIAQRLILLRGNRTKEEVALQLNISIRALESYETGQRTPRDSVNWRSLNVITHRSKLFSFKNDVTKSDE